MGAQTLGYLLSLREGLLRVFGRWDGNGRRTCLLHAWLSIPARKRAGGSLTLLLQLPLMKARLNDIERIFARDTSIFCYTFREMKFKGC